LINVSNFKTKKVRNQKYYEDEKNLMNLSKIQQAFCLYMVRQTTLNTSKIIKYVTENVEKFKFKSPMIKELKTGNQRAI